MQLKAPVVLSGHSTLSKKSCFWHKPYKFSMNFECIAVYQKYETGAMGGAKRSAEYWLAGGSVSKWSAMILSHV